MFDGDDDIAPDSDRWKTLLPESKLAMDQQHFFEGELQPVGPVNHVRMSIYPDGGISRLRLFGQVTSKE